MAKPWWSRLFAERKDLWEAVLFALQLLEKSGLPYQKCRLDDLETIAIYTFDCNSLGVTAEDVRRDVHQVRMSCKEFPSSVEFAKKLAKTSHQHFLDNFRPKAASLEHEPAAPKALPAKPAPLPPARRKQIEAELAAHKLTKEGTA